MDITDVHVLLILAKSVTFIKTFNTYNFLFISPMFNRNLMFNIFYIFSGLLSVELFSVIFVLLYVEHNFNKEHLFHQ